MQLIFESIANASLVAQIFWFVCKNDLVWDVKAVHINNTRFDSFIFLALSFFNAILHGFTGVWGNHHQTLPRQNLLD